MKKNKVYSLGICFVIIILITSFNNIDEQNNWMAKTDSEGCSENSYQEKVLNDILTSEYDLESLDFIAEEQKMYIHIKDKLSKEKLNFIVSQIEVLANSLQLI